jgi:hypothetical protein
MKAYCLLLALPFLATPLHGQQQPRLITLEKVEIEEGLVSSDVAGRFGLSKDGVESRLKAAFAANLSAQLSSSRQVNLSAREESLAKLMKEWEVSEKLGNPDSTPAVPGVDKADYVASAKITDLIANRDTLVLGGRVAAAKWRLLLEASFELVDVKTGRKSVVITEKVEDSGQSRGNANFTTLEIQAISRNLATQLATRIIDSLAPIRIIAIRGDDFIIDRGKSANVKVGDKYAVLEPAAGAGLEDAAFPVGSATVTFVNEKSANLRLERDKTAAATLLQTTMQVIKAAH